MLVYIIVNETEFGEKNVLGAFTDSEKASMKARAYGAEHPEEECWIETFDTDTWPYEGENEYKVVHRTRLGKSTGLMSHVIVLTKEPVAPVEEGVEWYTIQQVNLSFDKEEGLERNKLLLKAYLEEKKRS